MGCGLEVLPQPTFEHYLLCNRPPHGRPATAGGSCRDLPRCGHGLAHVPYHRPRAPGGYTGNRGSRAAFDGSAPSALPVYCAQSQGSAASSPGIWNSTFLPPSWVARISFVATCPLAQRPAPCGSHSAQSEVSEGCCVHPVHSVLLRDVAGVLLLGRDGADVLDREGFFDVTAVGYGASSSMGLR